MKHRPELVATMSLDELEQVIQEEQQTADRHQQAKALQKARAIVLQSRTWKNRPDLVETMSFDELERMIEGEKQTAENKLLRATLEARAAKNVADLLEMSLPSPPISIASTRSSDEELFAPGPFRAQRETENRHTQAHTRFPNDDESVPGKPEGRTTSMARVISKTGQIRPSDQALPPASSTFDEDYLEENAPSAYPPRDPSYDTDIPTLPANYADQESTVHSIRTAVHPKTPASTAKASVFRRKPSLCNESVSSGESIEAEWEEGVAAPPLPPTITVPDDGVPDSWETIGADGADATVAHCALPTKICLPCDPPSAARQPSKTPDAPKPKPIPPIMDSRAIVRHLIGPISPDANPTHEKTRVNQPETHHLATPTILGFGTESDSVPDYQYYDPFPDPTNEDEAVSKMDCDTDTIAQTESDLEDLLSAVHFQNANRPTAATTKPASQPQRHRSLRIVVLADGAGNKKVNPLKHMTSLLQAGQAYDEHFQILRWKAEGTEAPITSVKTVSLAHSNIRAYFKTRQVIITTLSGELRITANKPLAEVVAALAEWGQQNDLKIFEAPCQSEEKDNIGMIVFATKWLNAAHYKRAIRHHPLWATAGGFEFGLTMAFFTGDKEDKVKCLMVVVDKKHTPKAIHFFTALLNNTETPKPLLMPVYFYAMQNEVSSRNNRRALVKRHKEFAANERKLTIGGFRDLDTPLRLSRGTSLRTGRELLMMMRTGLNSSAFLLHGIDALVEDESLVYLRFPVQNQDTLQQRLPYLEDDLQLLVHPDDYSKLVLNPDMGLCHRGGWPLKEESDPSATPPEDQTEEEAMLSLVRRPALPILSFASAAASTPPSQPIPSIIVRLAQPEVSRPSAKHSRSDSISSGIPDTQFHHVMPPPQRPSTGNSGIVTPRTASSLVTDSSPQWQGEIKECVATLRKQHKQSARAIVYLSSALQVNSNDIHTLKSDVHDIKGDSAKILRFMEAAYGALETNDDFRAEMGEGNVK
jgi:hypothetical protein